MPAAVQAEYYLTRNLPGGPTFVYPGCGGIAVNYKNISLKTAAFLVDSGCRDIARVVPPSAPKKVPPALAGDSQAQAGGAKKGSPAKAGGTTERNTDDTNTDDTNDTE